MIIPIFIPHDGCTQRCVFCNQHEITGRRRPMDGAQVEAAIAAQIGRAADGAEVAFYGGSFTALPLGRQRELLTPAWRWMQSGRVRAIRVSTRPDCIDAAVLDNLRLFGVTTVELGVQSMDDAVLAAAARGHTARQAEDAVRRIRRTPLWMGLQMMVGLPGDTLASTTRTANEIARLRPDFVRIYPTVVLARTPLAAQYRAGRYRPLTLEEAVNRAAYLKAFFARRAIPVIRTGLQATAELADPAVLLAGPYHPAFGELAEMRLFYLTVARFLEQMPGRSRVLAIHHHPRDASKVRGLKNAHSGQWRAAYGLRAVSFIPDHPRRGQIAAALGDLRVILHKDWPEL